MSTQINSSISSRAKQFNLRDCLSLCSTTWDELLQTTIHNSWKKLGICSDPNQPIIFFNSLT